MLDNEVSAALRGREITPTVMKTSVRGRPGPALADNAMSASMVVIGASGDNAAEQGHLERFLTDHVECPVVVVSLDGAALREPVAG